jgi:beta-mannosidase
MLQPLDCLAAFLLQYDADCEDYSTYPKAKFISEFGSQSYPTFATYSEYTKPADWQVDNEMTGFRNRRFANGLEVLETQFKRHFRLPATCEYASKGDGGGG